MPANGGSVKAATVFRARNYPVNGQQFPLELLVNGYMERLL